MGAFHQTVKRTPRRLFFISSGNPTAQWADKRFPSLFFPRMSGTFLVSRGVGVFGADASTDAVNPFSEAYAIANNMRVASLSIAAYEYALFTCRQRPILTCDPAISSLSLLNFGFIGVRVNVGKKQVMLGRTDRILIGTHRFWNSLGLLLFILIRYIQITSSGTITHMHCRYTSVIVLFTSNFGFFYHHFTPKACSYYFYVTPVFKGTSLLPCRVWVSKAE